MVRYKVRAKMWNEKRITTTKYWLKKKNAQKYATATNKMKKGARAVVIKS